MDGIGLLLRVSGEDELAQQEPRELLVPVIGEPVINLLQARLPLIPRAVQHRHDRIGDSRRHESSTVQTAVDLAQRGFLRRPVQDVLDIDVSSR
ncbi:MAG: hypothetical protein QOF66_5117 [Mycobacterium sp.]|jgi:hypothetical protein|uniref:hypothetical protein n=1 Tax=Mycobacterium sp. TaxID=1785 RepID=UPI0028B529A6|nr:hypothetical protein [Mycobacterium sp.]